MTTRRLAAADSVGPLAARISERFAGESVQRCATRHPGIAHLDLTGQRLLGADAIGRHLLLRFDDATLHGHLRLDGRWVAGPRATEPEWRRRLELRLETGWLTALDIAVLQAVAPGGEHEVVEQLGPDLHDPPPPDLDEIAERMTSRPGQALVGALLERCNVGGFDDVYAVETCFICGVSPFQPVGTVIGLREVISVGAALISTTSTCANQNTTGHRIDISDHWVYDRTGSPCPVCRSIVTDSQTCTTPACATCWCPRCQPAVGRRVIDPSRSDRLLARHPALGLLHQLRSTTVQPSVPMTWRPRTAGS